MAGAGSTKNACELRRLTRNGYHSLQHIRLVYTQDVNTSPALPPSKHVSNSSTPPLPTPFLDESGTHTRSVGVNECKALFALLVLQQGGEIVEMRDYSNVYIALQATYVFANLVGRPHFPGV